MSQRIGYERLYRRVLGIGLLASVAVHGAILAWGHINVEAPELAEFGDSSPELALTYVERDRPLELLDVRVAEAEEVVASAPARSTATTTKAVAAPKLESPPKLAAASAGALIAINPVETKEEEVASVVEFDRLGAAVAAAARTNGEGKRADWGEAGTSRIGPGAGRGPIIIGGGFGGGGCDAPGTGIVLPGRRIGGFSGIAGAGIGRVVRVGR